MLTLRLYGGSQVTSWPWSSIRPDVGSSKPPIIRSVVVLPQPDGPRRLKNSPSWTSRSMWSTATASPNFLTTSTSLTSTVGTVVGTPGADSGELPRKRGIGAEDMGRRCVGCQGSAARGRVPQRRARFVAVRGSTDCGIRASRPIGRTSRHEPVRTAVGTCARPAGRRPRSGRAPVAPGARYDIDASAVRTRDAPSHHVEGTPPTDVDPHRSRHPRRPAHRPGAGARPRHRHPRHGQATSRSTATRVAFTIELTTPACPLKDEIEARRHAGVLGRIGVETVDITWGAMVRRAAAAPGRAARPGRQEHHRRRVGQGRRRQEHGQRQPRRRAGPGRAPSVGLLDADITGPNIPLMLGLEGQPKASAEQQDHAARAPRRQDASRSSSSCPEGQPIVWRGPLVGGAIQQFLRDVDWGELDYLVIDLPPGTSDAQLTLAQAVPISRRRPRDDAAGGVAGRRREGARDVPAHERAGPRPRREHDRVRLPALRRADRDLRPRRRRALRGRSTASSTSAASRSTSPSARAATSACRPSPSASRARRRRALTAIAQTVAARMSVRAAQNAGQPVLTIS